MYGASAPATCTGHMGANTRPFYRALIVLAKRSIERNWFKSTVTTAHICLGRFIPLHSSWTNYILAVRRLSLAVKYLYIGFALVNILAIISILINSYYKLASWAFYGGRCQSGAGRAHFTVNWKSTHDHVWAERQTGANISLWK